MRSIMLLEERKYLLHNMRVIKMDDDLKASNEENAD